MATVSPRPLLVELFVEELPPKALPQLGTAFGERVINGLVRFQLTVRESTFQIFATPRWLAVLGAEVIKLEIPQTGDLARQLGADATLNEELMGASFLAQNRPPDVRAGPGVGRAQHWLHFHRANRLSRPGAGEGRV